MILVRLAKTAPCTMNKKNIKNLQSVIYQIFSSVIFYQSG